MATSWRIVGFIALAASIVAGAVYGLLVASLGGKGDMILAGLITVMLVYGLLAVMSTRFLRGAGVG